MKKMMMIALSLMVAMSMSVPVFGQIDPEDSTLDYEPAEENVIVMEAEGGTSNPADPEQPAADPEQPAEETTEPVTDPTVAPTQPPKPTTKPTTAVKKSTKINGAKALTIALKSAKLSKSKVKWIETELEKGYYEVEFTRKSNRAEYDYKIKQSNGKIYKKSVEYKYKKSKSKKKIGKTKARKKVAQFANVPYKYVKAGTCKYEKDDGVRKYDLKFKYKGLKYEVEVLAKNGKVTEYEWRR